TDFSIRDLGIPTGIRQVLIRRLDRLSASTKQVLNAVAALDGGFEFRILPRLVDLPEDALLDCLDEALRAGILRAIGGAAPTYDCAHAIVRWVLYENQNPERRARLHRRVAVAIEELHAGHELEHASELAAHYRASAFLPGATRGVAY